MGLIQILTEASKKDIIVNKIGLSEEVAQSLINKYGQKRALLYANFIVKWKNYLFVDDEVLDGVAWDLLNNIEYFLSSNNKPKDLFNIIKKGKPHRGARITYKEYDWSLNVMNQALTSIKDYIERTGTSISDKTLEEAHDESIEWHDTLEATGKSIELKEGQEIVHKFEDGYYWVDLGTTNCEDEAESMGHCGHTSAETMLSLRDPDHVPHVTVAFDYDGTYYQMKGKGNKKPVEKYHKYCAWLFTDEAEDYQITDRESEYDDNEDFVISDYYEKNPELVDKILEENPDLQHITEAAQRLVSKYSNINDVPNEEIKSFLLNYDEVFTKEYISGEWWNILTVGFTELGEFIPDLNTMVHRMISTDVWDFSPDKMDIEHMIQDIDFKNAEIVNKIIGRIEESIEKEEIDTKAIATTISSLTKVAEGWEQFKDMASPSDWYKFMVGVYEGGGESSYDDWLERLYKLSAAQTTRNNYYKYIGDNINPLFDYRGDLEIEEVLLTVKPSNSKQVLYNPSKHSAMDIEESGTISMTLSGVLAAILSADPSSPNYSIIGDFKDILSNITGKKIGTKDLTDSPSSEFINRTIIPS